MNTLLSGLVRASQGVTALGAITGLFALMKMGAGVSALASGFTVWVLLPFGITLMALMRRPSSIIGTLGLLACGAFGLAMYFDLVFPSTRLRSTAGLAFLFVPFWQTAGSVVAVALSLSLDYFNLIARCPTCGQRWPRPRGICATCASQEAS